MRIDSVTTGRRRWRQTLEKQAGGRKRRPGADGAGIPSQVKYRELRNLHDLSGVARWKDRLLSRASPQNRI